MDRHPDYYNGRFFLSPLLGCTARCSFCYIFPSYSASQAVNEFTPQQCIEWVKGHKDFRPGRSGSIIAIGAWGDPFPATRSDLHSVSLQWLKAACSLGNPIQIMSRFGLNQQLIEGIARCPAFERQMLWSTSIVTFNRWERIERGADPPQSRLATVKQFARLGVPTNVMIKPFLPGITDKESGQFIDGMMCNDVNYCVVGALQWNSSIATRMHQCGAYADTALLQEVQAGRNNQVLDCSSTDILNAFPSSTCDEFVGTLAAAGIKVFKKSACVTSHVLQEPIAELIFLNDTNGFCVKCGVCETASKGS